MVYSFFDPDLAPRGLGNLLILDHIEQVKLAGLTYVYLGYWVKDSPKMAYKGRYPSARSAARPDGLAAAGVERLKSVGYHCVEPEVAGGWGENTQFTRTPGRSVVVRRLHYSFDGWLGDELIESTPCYIVTERMAGEIKRARMPSQVEAILISTRSRPMPALSLELDQAVRAFEHGLGIERQARIHFGGDTTAGDGLQDFHAKGDQQTVDDFGSRGVRMVAHGLFQQRLVFILLHGLQDQRRIRRRIARRVCLDRLEVAGVGHHGSKLLQLFELVHGCTGKSEWACRAIVPNSLPEASTIGLPAHYLLN